MPDLTADELLRRVYARELVTDRQVDKLRAEVGRRNLNADQLVQYMLRKELLTNFQIERIVRDEIDGYFYGDYKVLYMVAAGSFARVYRAVHRTTNQVVALKVLRKRYCDDHDHVDQFYREGLLGVGLRHPHIVRVLDVFSKGRVNFFTMEFVEGRNLREFLRARKVVSPLEATKIISQVCDALNFALTKGVWHRDLKLTNVLISSSGETRLIDFGLAGKGEKDESEEAVSQRTIDYAGLEKNTNSKRDDPRSDLYFVGSIYYHMLTGKPALLETRDRSARVARSRFENVVPIHVVDSSLPHVVVSIVNRAMQLDVERRYQTPGEMLVDLHIAMERLQKGEADSPDGANVEISREERQRLAFVARTSKRQPTVMVIEPRPEVQDLFRGALKKMGYRVLITRDAERALGQFSDTKQPADCVLFGTSEDGEQSLEAFVRFAEGEFTNQIPAAVLLDERHAGSAPKLQGVLNDRRVIVPLPIKMRGLRETVAKLLPPPEVEAQA